MPKKHITPLDAARQQIKAILAERKRAEARARKLRAKNKQKAELREVAIRARALKKLGLYNPKNPIKQSTITKAQKRAIDKKFNTLQRHGKYIEKGHTVRPLIKEARVTKSGRIVEKYSLSKYFAQVKTKQKVSAKTGAIKTSKGYVIEKDDINSKVRIVKGDVVQTTKHAKGKPTITRRRGIKGQAIAKFVEDIEDERIRIKDDQVLVYHRFGRSYGGNVKTFDSDELDLFAAMFRDYEKTMSPKVFGEWLDYTELLIRDN